MGLDDSNRMADLGQRRKHPPPCNYQSVLARLHGKCNSSHQKQGWAREIKDTPYSKCGRKCLLNLEIFLKVGKGVGEQGKGSSSTEKNPICLVLRITRSQHQKGIILASSQYFSHWTSPLTVQSSEGRASSLSKCSCSSGLWLGEKCYRGLNTNQAMSRYNTQAEKVWRNPEIHVHREGQRHK